MKLPHIYQVTKYDSDDWDESGRYIGPEDVFSDHGPVEFAYLATVRGFIEDSDLTSVTVREPAVTGFVDFGVEPTGPDRIS
jgi:hypothetical protein